MLDIDSAESYKFNNNSSGLDLALAKDAKQFMEALLVCLDEKDEFTQDPLEPWVKRGENWGKRHPIFSEIERKCSFPSSYFIFDKLGWFSTGTEYFSQTRGSAWL